VAAKLPAPSEEAKAKAAEAAAKAAHAGKTDAFQLCKAQDKVIAHQGKAKEKAKDAKAAAPSACVDPGPFVYTPAAPAAPASAPVVAASAPVAADKTKKP
jgi:hypothetical protein